MYERNGKVTNSGNSENSSKCSNKSFFTSIIERIIERKSEWLGSVRRYSVWGCAMYLLYAQQSNNHNVEHILKHINITTLLS